MMRAFLSVLVLSAILASWAPPGLGAGPKSGSSRQRNDTKPSPKARVEEFQGLGVDRHLGVFAGTVLDVNEHPVPNVVVDLFVDGELAGNTTTDESGIYEIKVPYDPNSDTTVLLWYVPQTGRLLPKELVIRESKASIENGLISRCVPRAELLPGRQFRVYLFDPTTRNKDLAELNCLP